MKNALCIAIALAAAALTACSKKSNNNDKPAGYETPAPLSSMRLDSVVWAAVHVDEFQTFAARPDMYTKYYQWNRAKAWNSADSAVTGWDSHPDISSEWKTNPCPEGWRLPTLAEYQALDRAGSTWADAGTKGNAVAGRFYGANHASCALNGSMEGCVFFPASGYREEKDGSLYYKGYHGYSWSSTQKSATEGYYFEFTSVYSAYEHHYLKDVAMPVRCVNDI